MAVDNQSYKVTLEATDPAIRFGEYVDYPQCNCGWTTTFAGGVAPATFGQQPGEMGVGKGTRAATKVGSFAEFEFYGVCMEARCPTWGLQDLEVDNTKPVRFICFSLRL